MGIDNITINSDIAVLNNNDIVIGNNIDVIIKVVNMVNDDLYTLNKYLKGLFL